MGKTPIAEFYEHGVHTHALLFVYGHSIGKFQRELNIWAHFFLRYLLRTSIMVDRQYVLLHLFAEYLSDMQNDWFPSRGSLCIS